MQYISLDDVRRVVRGGEAWTLPPKALEQVEAGYRFLEAFSRDKIIYGINTGFGPMAQWRVEDEHLKELQYNIIRSHSCGAGEAMPDIFVRACMLARLGSLLQAKSGVHPETVSLLQAFLNNGITPFVPRHGSVGASGDLVQLAHVALCLIGEGQCHVRGEEARGWQPTGEVMKRFGLQPMHIHIREGLCVTNGTSMMTGIAAVNQLQAERLLDLHILAAVWMNEIAGSYDDLMAEPLQQARPHEGQIEVARRMRELSADSQCLQQREHTLYDGIHTDEKVFSHKVQPYYSLRCTPQIMGPILETLRNARRVIEEELNSASDNPIVDAETQNVYHGGNFHGDYISLEQDKVKIALTRMAMTGERQLNYLMHDRINGILPPFLNRGQLGLNYGMQALQFTATSTTAECQTLSMPNYVHSIPNNNDNQDIVSMGTNTALITAQVIDNVWQVTAVLMMALAEATDCLNIRTQLSSATRSMYDRVRVIVAPIEGDRTYYQDLQNLINGLQ